MVSPKRMPAELRDATGWKEPTEAERAAAFARRQERCPFDLSKMHEWPPGSLLEWGRWAIENDIRPELDGDVDQLLFHARRTALRHDALLDDALDNFIRDFDFFCEGLRA